MISFNNLIYSTSVLCLSFSAQLLASEILTNTTVRRPPPSYAYATRPLVEKSFVGDPRTAIRPKVVHGIKELNERGIDGRGINVALVDRLVDPNHPRLVGRVEGCNPVCQAHMDASPVIFLDHGTHVAGIIAATTGGDYADAGVAPAANILVARNAADQSTVEMLNNAAESEAHIVNISWGYSNQEHYHKPYKAAQLEAFRNIARAGKLIIKSAGNGSSTADNAKQASLFAVAAEINSNPDIPGAMLIVMNAKRTKNRPGLVRSSNRPHIEDIAKYSLCAFGDNIRSTLPRGRFGGKTGTSMATPYVSGAAALLMQAHPELSPKIIALALLEAAVDIGDVQFGKGYLNAIGAHELLSARNFRNDGIDMSEGLDAFITAELNKVATKIQALVRGRKVRKDMAARKEAAEKREADATKIQALWQGVQARKIVQRIRKEHRNDSILLGFMNSRNISDAFYLPCNNPPCGKDYLDFMNSGDVTKGFCIPMGRAKNTGLADPIDFSAEAETEYLLGRGNER